MNYEENYEAEIDLKDLLFHILYRWRSIILGGLIFAILLAGFQIMRRGSEPAEVSVDGSDYTKAASEYEIALAEYELNKSFYEREIEYYEKLLEQQEIYLENAVLMQIDPSQEARATADFFVTLDDSGWEALPDNISIDPTDALLKMYTSNFATWLDWKQIEKETGYEELYLKELLSISADYTTNSFTVTVMYSDVKTAGRILDLVTAQIMEKYQDMSESAREHTLTVSNPIIVSIIDKSLMNTQKEQESAISDYQLTILDYEKKLLELEEPVEPEEIVELATNMAPGRAGGLINRKTLKFAVLGFAAGVFLMAVFYAVLYIFDGKLHGEKELKDRYGYSLLGALPQKERAGFLSGIDHFLERLEGTRQRLSKEEAYRRISVNIANLSEGRKNILLTGTMETESLQELAAAISPSLENVHFIVSANMNQDTDTLTALARCDAVILAEGKNRSRSLEIQKEQESIKALGKPVIGYVML